MNEQEFINHLREETQNTPIPEQLEPEHIREQLSSNADIPKSRRKWYRSPWLYTAASLFVCITGLCGVLYVNHFPSSPNGSASPESDDLPVYTEEAAELKAIQEEEETDDTNVDADYAELFRILKDNSIRTFSYPPDISEDSNAFNEHVESASSDASQSKLDSAAREYSDTNSQIATVAEADIVKTDGDYIYSCYSQSDSLRNAVAITHAKQGHLSVCSVLSPESISEVFPDMSQFNIKEMYLSDRRLILLCTVWKSSSTERSNMNLCYDSAISPATDTYILTYDVSNPKTPKLLGSLKQEGAYTDSRLSDGYLYTFTGKWIEIPQDASYNAKYFPHANDKLLAYHDIYLPDNTDSSFFQIITGLSLNDPTDFTASKAILSGTGTYYISPNHIYFAHQNSYDETELIRFSYVDGELGSGSHLTFTGTILNQFSMDEYHGYLRVAVTTDDGVTISNALYIISPDMEISGSVTGLAPYERIYSVRFMGEIAYCVTYRETDPLFAIDVSDPENPTVTDALKIPGFSNYLHFYSDTLLLGIGEETNPDTGEHMGTKLSMFDITDPYQIKVADTVVLSDMYFTPVQYDHKALLIDADKNLIGFYGECYNRDAYEYSRNYLIYSYSTENGFQERFQCNVAEDSILSSYNDELYFYDMRGLYIDDYLYLVNGNRICSYALRDFSRKEGLVVRGDGNHISTTGNTTN